MLCNENILSIQCQKLGSHYPINMQLINIYACMYIPFSEDLFNRSLSVYLKAILEDINFDGESRIFCIASEQSTHRQEIG